MLYLVINNYLFLSTELSSPRSVTSSRGSYGLPSPFGGVAYPGMKSVATGSCTDNQSPAVAAAGAVTCTAGSLSSNQSHLSSPLPVSAAKDEPYMFPITQCASLCMPVERQVLNLLFTCLRNSSSGLPTLSPFMSFKEAITIQSSDKNRTARHIACTNS